jgi:hypothetical protein
MLFDYILGTISTFFIHHPHTHTRIPRTYTHIEKMGNDAMKVKKSKIIETEGYAKARELMIEVDRKRADMELAIDRKQAEMEYAIASKRAEMEYAIDSKWTELYDKYLSVLRTELEMISSGCAKYEIIKCQEH